jgi:hypothetical protein
MAAAATLKPVALSPEDEARLTAPPPLADVQFYGALTPRDSLPLLAISGVTGKAFWIGSLPQPPEEEEDTEDEESDSEEETKQEPQVCPRVPAHPLRRDLARPRRFSPSPETTRKPSRSRRARSRLPTTPPLSPQEWDIAKVREERRAEAEEMYRLWREDPEQWLIRSKIAWAKRHESKRKKSHARADVPTIVRPGAGGRSSGGGRTTNTSKRAERAAGASGAPKPFGRVTVSLKMLVDAGIMTPGPDAVFLSYLGQTWSGELDALGQIHFRGKAYGSPSAWAIFCKRLANPGKKADDGWKSVRYGAAEGPVLDELKQEYLTGVKPALTPSSRAGSSAKKRTPSARKAKQRADSDDDDSDDDDSDDDDDGDDDASDDGEEYRPKRPRENAEETPEASRKAVKTDPEDTPGASDAPTLSPSPVDMSWLDRYPDATEGKTERDAGARMVAPGEEYASLVGRVAQVYWPSESTWYTGRVLSYDGAGRVSVLYASGDVEQGIRIDLLSAQRMFCVLE